MTHVVDAKLIESLGDLDLLLGVKESVGELLTLTERALDDLEAGDIAEEVGHADVVAVGVAGGGGVRVLASLDGREAGVFTFGKELISVVRRQVETQDLPLAVVGTPFCPLGSLSAPGHIMESWRDGGVD